jgi:tetratricopeptide (TPR) repeat protein
VVLAGTTFVVGNERGSHVTPCAGGEAEIASVWAPVRAASLAHLRALGPYGAAEADRLASDLDAYGADWADAHRDACLAHERRELTDAVYERGLGCLARARARYESVIDVLGSITPPRLGNTIEAAHGLPAANRCVLESQASIIPPPPSPLAAQVDVLANDIERARILAITDDPRGVAATARVVARASALGYVPLVSRAKLAHGLALLEAQDAAEAIPVLGDAWIAAVDAFDDVTLVEAFARQLYARSVVTDPQDDDTRGALALVERVAVRSGTAGTFARALLYNNLGTVRLGLGDAAGARAWFDRSLRETGGREREPELVGTYANRALVTDDPTERDKLFATARATLARELGVNHRKTLDVRFQAAFFIEDSTRAEAELRDLCAIYQRFHASVASDTIANCFYELGWLAEARGDRAGARAAMTQVPTMDGPAPPMAAAHLLALSGKPDEAIIAARRVAEAYREQAWGRFNAADAYLFIAQREGELGRRAAAIADARAALALFEQLPHLARMPHYQRRVACVRALLTAGPP